MIKLACYFKLIFFLIQVYHLNLNICEVRWIEIKLIKNWKKKNNWKNSSNNKKIMTKINNRNKRRNRSRVVRKSDRKFNFFK